MTLSGIDLEADFASDLLNGFPAEFRIGDGARAAHEGDAAMAQSVEMCERLFDCEMMIEDDVGDVFNGAVSGDGDHGNWDVDVIRGGVENQKAIDGAFHQHARVLLDELALPVMAGGEVEVVGRREFLNYATHHAREVAFAQIGGEDADAHGAALTQRAGKVVGAVVEALGGFDDALAGFFGDGLGRGRTVENE